MAKELFDDELDDITGGINLDGGKRLFEIWRKNVAKRFDNYDDYLKAAKTVIGYINDGKSIEEILSDTLDKYE